MSSIVDTSVVLQIARNEPGFEKVLPKLYQGRVSAVNFAEAVNKLVRDGMPANRALAIVTPLCRNVIPFTAEHAGTVAFIREQAKGSRLSLGDVACLAVGKSENATVLTNDGAWTEFDFGVKLETGRPPAKKPA